MKAVTDRAKRYVFACFACNGFGVSTRKDSLTCSPRCRVRLHRDPEAREQLEFVRAELGISPGYFARSMAARRIAPELMEKHRNPDAIAAEVFDIACRMARENA